MGIGGVPSTRLPPYLGSIVRLATGLGFGQSSFQAWIATLPVAMVLAGRTDTDIGIAVGAAAIFNVIASLAVGGLIDRYGGARLFMVGSALLLAGSLAFAAGIVEASSPLPALFAVRFIQGAGLAAIIPSGLSMVPALVTGPRLPTALASVGVAANISLALVPPLTLVVLDHCSLAGVGVAAAISGIAGAVLIGTMRSVRHAPTDAGGHRFRFGWRRSWTAPLLACSLYIVHWGVITSYLPQRAEAAGAEIGLFFSGDAVALLLVRIPGGHLVGRFGATRMMVSGLAITVASVALLLLPVTTPLLVIAGAGTGLGAAFVLPAVLIELTLRSNDADRGSAFGLYSVAFGSGIVIGSIGAAPFVNVLGFHGILLIGIGACLVAAAVSAWDSRRPSTPSEPPDAADAQRNIEARLIAEAETEPSGA